jgi:hypothetical protein
MFRSHWVSVKVDEMKTRNFHKGSPHKRRDPLSKAPSKTLLRIALASSKAVVSLALEDRWLSAGEEDISRFGGIGVWQRKKLLQSNPVVSREVLLFHHD